MRAELTAAIKESARRQLAVEGAGGLSLRAIARELDMASSAIYRYFASRDELLTSLIIDAYDAIGQVVEAADATCERSDHHGRFQAMARAIRDWAHANPHAYALIYGSPVPGYQAPQDTIDPAVRVPIALLGVIVDRFGEPEPNTGAWEGDQVGLAAALTELGEFTGHRVAPERLAPAVAAWGQILGLVSLELFGHFTNAVSDPEALFAHTTSAVADRLFA